MNTSQVPKFGEGRRRKTVFRKFRQLCDLFNMRAMVVLTDSENRHWIFKTHEDVPGVQQAMEHPRTQTYDDFHLMNYSNGARIRRDSRPQQQESQVTLQPPTFRRGG
ncbi:hypothetical protein BDV40DRAFT_303409 [Aspergillus tamarii]|uniref:MADS-box domain-containing protein n=1 Tax=Aspergillus tamarii TaxID=41984 RepID=A0A5N6UKU6_ASPTM|nr:hypothetical protein BDV40DRAFT_303409 [Aspergillus tamarii]